MSALAKDVAIARHDAAVRRPLELANLTRLMERSSGRAEIAIALVSGPVLVSLGCFANSAVHVLSRGLVVDRAKAPSLYATFLASMLAASRSSVAPAICPASPLLVRSVGQQQRPDVAPETNASELAAAITDAIDAGARIVNIGATVRDASPEACRELQRALDLAASHDAIVVATGAHADLVSALFSEHAAVIVVAAAGAQADGAPDAAHRIGTKGLSAPGDVSALGLDGRPLRLRGAGVAAPLVTGTIALLWSLFPRASRSEVLLALTRGYAWRLRLLPPALDAWRSYERLQRAT
jgi:hypothetical protein